MRLIVLALALVVSNVAVAQSTDAAVAKAQAEAAEKDKVDIAQEAEKLRAEAAKAAKDADKPPQGLKLDAKIGATGSFVQNQNFVGQADGVTMQFGVLALGKADYLRGSHDWRNSLSIEHAQLKAPNLSAFVKSADALELKSLYLYHVPKVEWFGPFARARAFTQIFPGYVVRETPTTVVATKNDGSVETRTVGPQQEIELTNFFEPLVLEESIGVFVEPVRSKVANLNLKAGLGAQQVITQEGFATADNPDTPELELTQLGTVLSAGVEASAELNGVLVDKVLSYAAGTGVYYPLLISDARGLEGADLLHFYINGGLSLKLTKWASIDYALKIVKEPFVLNEVQIQNTVLISAAFDIL